MERKFMGIFVCFLLVFTTMSVTGYKNVILTSGEDDVIVEIGILSDSRWMKTFGGIEYDNGYSVKQTFDNGYIIVGVTNSYGGGEEDIWLIRTDPNGNELWNKTFGGSPYEKGYDVEQTTDGGYILVGADGKGSGWLLKTDCDGNLEWDKKFFDCCLYKIHETSNEGLIIVGVTSSSSKDYFILLLMVDKDGNELWRKNFGCIEPNFRFDVEQTIDGGYIINGIYFLIKTDCNGLEEWILEFNSNMECHDVLQNSDGGYTAVCYKDGWPTNMTGVMIITDSDGEILYSKNYKGIFTGYRPDSICQTEDGGYIITGQSNREFPGGRLTLKLWLAKTDKFGRLLWSRRIGGANWDFGKKVQKTIDGGYIIVGGTHSFAKNDSVDIWLVKTDKNGFIRPPLIYLKFLEFLEFHPNLFPILRQFLPWSD